MFEAPPPPPARPPQALLSGPLRPEYVEGPLVHEAFEAAAARAPHSPCLSYEGDTLSYAEVSAQSGELAEQLAAAGAGPDAPVALLLDRGPDYVVAVLAVLKVRYCWVLLVHRAAPVAGACTTPWELCARTERETEWLVDLD